MGTVPTSGGLSDIEQMLGGGKTSSISNEDIQQALSPSISHMPQSMPASLTTPRREVLPGAMLDHREVIGKGNARAQGIGNTVSATTRMVGNMIARRDNQKQMAEATRVQQLLAAQSGADQAQQILKGDPKNAEAQQSLQHNQSIIQGLFQDPKFVKTVQNGFQISLTDPSQNKTDHHSIVQKGIELFKKHQQQNFSPDQAKQMASRWQQSIPTQMVPNQAAIQRLQLRQSLQKDQASLMRAVLPAMIREQAASKRLEFTQKEADRRAELREQGENGRKLFDATAKFQLQNLRYQQQMGIAYLHAGLQLRNMERVLTEKGVDPAKLLTARDSFDQKMTHSEQAQEHLVLALTQDRDTYQYDGKVDKDVLLDKNHKIFQAEQSLKEMKTAHSAGMQEFSDRITGKVSLDGTGIPATKQSEQPAGAGKSDPRTQHAGTPSGNVATGLANSNSLEETYKLLGLADTEDEEDDDY